MNKTYKILYVCHDRIHMAGAVNSMVNLIESLGESVSPVILVRKGEVCNKLKDLGYKCITFPFQLSLSRENQIHSSVLLKFRIILDVLINSLCVIYVTLKLKKQGIDIVHSNSVATDIGYKIANKMKSKHVWHVREFLDLDFNTKPARGWKHLKDKMYKSDCVIAISKAVYRHWNLENCKKSVVLPNAVRSANDAQYNTNKEKSFLFCSATLNDNKGTDFAVRLFCESRLYKEGYRLKLIGKFTEEYKSRLETIANKYNQDNYVDYLGYRQDVTDYMLKASAFLMCSKNEAMGRVTVEAFFYGCPVLGHNTGGTSELIQDGINGFLYSDMEEAKSKLYRIIHDEKNTDLMVKNAMEKAKHVFSKEAYAQKIKKVYSDVLG